MGGVPNLTKQLDRSAHVPAKSKQASLEREKEKETVNIVHLRGSEVAMVIGNDLAALVLPNANARVCGAEVNANCRFGAEVNANCRFV